MHYARKRGKINAYTPQACVLRPYMLHVCVPRPKRTIVREMYEIATARQTRKAQFIYTSRNYFQTKVSYIKQIIETLAKAFIYDTFIYQFIFISCNFLGGFPTQKSCSESTKNYPKRRDAIMVTDGLLRNIKVILI